jgi:hypothetical protein
MKKVFILILLAIGFNAQAQDFSAVNLNFGMIIFKVDRVKVSANNYAGVVAGPSASLNEFGDDQEGSAFGYRIANGAYEYITYNGPLKWKIATLPAKLNCIGSPYAMTGKNSPTFWSPDLIAVSLLSPNQHVSLSTSTLPSIGGVLANLGYPGNVTSFVGSSSCQAM